MRQNREVIQAWLDGKVIEFRSNSKSQWMNFSKDTTVNPMTFQDLEWRVKPVKKVSYRALIDSGLIITFYNRCFTSKSPYKLSRMLIRCEDYYKDEDGITWDCIQFENKLKQVVSASDFKKLVSAGFDVEEIFSYSDDSDDDKQVAIILEGIQEGYTL